MFRGPTKKSAKGRNSAIRGGTCAPIERPYPTYGGFRPMELCSTGRLNWKSYARTGGLVGHEDELPHRALPRWHFVRSSVRAIRQRQSQRPGRQVPPDRVPTKDASCSPFLRSLEARSGSWGSVAMPPSWQCRKSNKVPNAPKEILWLAIETLRVPKSGIGRQ